MEKQLDRQVVEEVVEEVGAELRTDYSGRGMYGKTCWGVVADTAQHGKFIAMLSDQQGWVKVSELIDGEQTDAMGLDTIYYYPGWELV